MGTKRSINHDRKDSEEDLSVPPGFVSLTSLTFKRIKSGEAAEVTSNGMECKPSSIRAPISNLDIEMLEASLSQKPWLLHDQSDCAPEKRNLEQTEVQMKHPVSACLRRGVIRGCGNCHDCVKVTARWRPEESLLPMVDDAPVFRPTEEEFKDTLKYIAKLRLEAENFGICRIVPPPSWRPPCLLKDRKTWEASKFSSHVQQINELRDMYLKKKLSRLHEKTDTRNSEALSSMEHSSGECAEDTEKHQCLAVSPGFEIGPDFTLKGFKNYADDFKKQYFSAKALDSETGPVREWREPLTARVEGEYWRVIENPSEEIEVLCCTSGSQTSGGGFPMKDSLAEADIARNSEYVESGWNLNNTPKLPGSLLPFGCYDSSAILIPQLFIGMCFSSQCWRIEDHHLYSLCYMHLGDSKVWYGIPGKYCFKFREVVKKLFPQLRQHPELLHDLVIQLSPSVLMSHGIPVYRCVQNPLEFVLIFPGAYHSEFSCGFNCTEAVCFAPLDWLPHGHSIAELYGEYCRKTSLSYDKLLVRAAMEATCAQWELWKTKSISTNHQLWKSACTKDGILMKALKARVKLEGLRTKHFHNLSRSRIPDENDAATKMRCSICRVDLFISAIGCSCSPNRYTCLHHANQLCSCAWEAKCYFFRYEIGELNLLVDALEGNLKAMHSWAKKAQPVTGSFVPKDALRNGNILHSDSAHAINGIAVNKNKNVRSVFKLNHGANEEKNVGSCEQNKASTSKFPADSSQQNGVHLSDSNASSIVSSREKDCIVDGAAVYPDSSDIFTTDQLFSCREDAEKWVRATGRGVGVFLSVRGTKKNRVYLSCSCERSSQCRNAKPRDGEVKSQKFTVTKKTQCPFQIKLVKKSEDKWVVKVNRGRHNHYVHVGRHCRTSPTKLTNNMGNISTLQHVLAGKKIERTGMGDLKPLSYFFKLAKDHNYVLFKRKDKKTDRLTDIFLAHPKTSQMLLLFPQVLIMDVTRKTYAFDMSLVQITGVVPTGQNFHVAFAWMKNEQQYSFVWVLQKLKGMYADGVAPKVIVTDCKLAAMKAIEAVFGDTACFLCQKHIAQDIRNHLMKIFGNKESADSFVGTWRKIVNSQTEVKYREAVADFDSSWQKVPEFVKYLHKWWLDPYHTRFVTAWTKQHMHFGTLTTNRVESARYHVNSLLGIYRFNFHTTFPKIHEFIELQYNGIRSELEKSSTVHPHTISHGIFRRLGGVVSHRAIDLLVTECRKTWKADKCSCELASTHGLPCGCMMLHLYDNRTPIDPVDINIFWKTLDIDSGSQVEDTEQATR